MRLVLRTLCLALLLLAPGLVRAEPAQFDLVGPTLEIKVTHAGATLPIAEAPNLAVGDEIWIRADLPPAQSVHYLLVATFLRGATNPPPEDWFHRSETWTQKGRSGLRVSVPKGAEQLLVFLVPDARGDLTTLMGAVRGRPGAFVRASQDLNQASLDRSRLETFLASIRKNNQVDPDRLKTVSSLLARSLTLKLNPDCLQKPPELQASCLMEGQDSIVLSDGHSASIVQALTTGSTADLAQQLSATPQAGFGYYSPYVGAVLDIARILDSFHTPQYQYIPALAAADGDALSLLLNTAPSFHDPMSVLVVALPAVEPPQAPPLQPVDAKAVYCASKPDLVLPVEGAPLAFSTAYAHDMVLRIGDQGEKSIDLPVRADAERGGFIADTRGVQGAPLRVPAEGSLHGFWGFAPFDGPSFHLEAAQPQTWNPVDGEDQSLVVGRDDVLHLRAAAAACVESVSLKTAAGDEKTLEWKSPRPDEIAASLPLADVQPGPLTLLIKQYGAAAPDTVPLQAFAQSGRLDSFELHAGDASGVLHGTRLDEVEGLSLGGVVFKPADLTSVRGADQLEMTAVDPEALGKLAVGRKSLARVQLKDRRLLKLEVVMAPARPSVSLLAKSIKSAPAHGAVRIELTDKNELVQGSTLIFSIRAEGSLSFTGKEAVEVATADGVQSSVLKPGEGLLPADSKVAVATLDTAKAFNGSAFGPLKFRILSDGAAGAWIPLATLVRLPEIHDLRCPGEGRCELSGSNLFLIASIASEASFAGGVEVPEGFPGSTLAVPHPRGGRLYLKLRDDPSVIDVASLSRERAAGGSDGPTASAKAGGGPDPIRPSGVP